MSINSSWFALSAPLAAAILSACAGAGQQAQPLSLPKLPSVGSISEAIPAAMGQPVGSATDIYARIAQGAMGCWFGANGPLKKDYIFHASADAPSRGGKAQIVIHQRDPTQPNPRGAKAYQINIDPTGESSATIKTENLRMTGAFATAMTQDVGRWSKGDQGCSENSTVVGWVPAPPAAAEIPKPTHKAKKSKVKSAPPKPAAEQ
jgi:hypothetical protein